MISKLYNQSEHSYTDKHCNLYETNSDTEWRFCSNSTSYHICVIYFMSP